MSTGDEPFTAEDARRRRDRRASAHLLLAGLRFVLSLFRRRR